MSLLPRLWRRFLCSRGVHSLVKFGDPYSGHYTMWTPVSVGPSGQRLAKDSRSFGRRCRHCGAWKVIEAAMGSHE